MEHDVETTREARNLALRRIALREHSARELETYLKRRKIPAAIATEVVAQLVEERLLDDRRFARVVTRSHALREKGPGYIQQKLQQKGVPLELSEIRTLFDEASDVSEQELARKLVERRYPRAATDDHELRRAYAALLRRGFSHAITRQALSGRSPEEE